jgi:hypothetical protein
VLIFAGVSLPRAGRLVARVLGVALAMGAAGAPAALAMASAAATSVSPAPSERTTTPPPEPASDNPPGADTSATTPSTAPAVPPEEGAATAVAGENGQASEAASSSVATTRPRFAMSVAVGVSVDNHGIGDGRNVLVPSFAVQGGIGEGLFGFGLRLFASEAAGRFTSLSPAGKPVYDLGADRQALDLLLDVRPLAPAWADAGDAWTSRFARALALEIGLAGERVSLGTKSILREGFVAGAHMSLPVVRSADGSELFVTVVVRRMIAAGQTVDVGGNPQSIGDSRFEAFSGLTVAF